MEKRPSVPNVNNPHIDFNMAGRNVKKVPNPKESHDENVQSDRIDFDDLLLHIGEFGRYQKCLFLCIIPFLFFMVFVYCSQIFITLVPENYWCRVPELEHLTMDKRYSFFNWSFSVRCLIWLCCALQYPQWKACDFNCPHKTSFILLLFRILVYYCRYQRLQMRINLINAECTQSIIHKCCSMALKRPIRNGQQVHAKMVGILRISMCHIVQFQRKYVLNHNYKNSTWHDQFRIDFSWNGYVKMHRNRPLHNQCSSLVPFVVVYSLVGLPIDMVVFQL